VARKLGYVFAFLIAGALALGVIAEWLKSFDEGAVTPILVKSSGDDPLTAVAWLESNRILADRPFTLHIRFLNRSDEAIQNVMIEQVMAEHLTFSRASFIVGKLQPHQRSSLLPIEARPLVKSGQHSLVIAYTWTDKAGPAMGALRVGPITVTTTTRTAVARIGGPIISLFKDLALPVVLAVGAWLLQRAEKRRDESRKQDEDARAASMKVAEEQRTRSQAAWNLMLPVSHDLNTKYYLPIIGAIEKIGASIRGKDPSRVAFYWVFSAMRNMRQLSLDKGGLFLKDMRGESTVSEIWGLFMTQQSLHFDLAMREKALKGMGWREDLPTFNQRFEKSATGEAPPLFSTLLAAFDSWLAQDFAATSLPVLDLFRLILLHELNRPFSLWYDAPLQFPALEVQELEKELRELSPSAAGALWIHRLARVLENVAKYREIREKEGVAV